MTSMSLRAVWVATLVAAAVVLADQPAPAQSPSGYRVSTRFGDLSVGADEVLQIKGRRVSAPLKGNSSVYIGKPVRIGAADVVLITNVGGTACPRLYYFVTVTQAGAESTHTFGTCNAVVSVKHRGNIIHVTMHGYRGPFEPRAEQRKAAAQTHSFVYQHGNVSEEGVTPRAN